MELKRATRKQVKLKIGMSAVSGGGKTYSALLIAYGICGDWSKVAVIDTENDSASLYSHLGEFNSLPLSAPYSPERYIEAIQTCEKAGMEVIIIDSITHEWDGKGGIMEISNSMPGNSFTNWAKITPRHQSFIDAILQSKCHVITCVRRKQDYEMTKDSNGKLQVQKAGLKEITRDGFEYELTVNLEINTNHQASASKDRTGLFVGKPEFIPTIETGKLLKNWCNMGGVEPVTVEVIKPVIVEPAALINNYVHACNKLKKATSIQELKDFWSLIDKDVQKHPAVEDQKNAMKLSLTKQPV